MMRKQSDYASYDPRYEEDQSPLARIVAEGELVKGGNIVPLPDKSPDCNGQVFTVGSECSHDAVQYVFYVWGGHYGKA